MVELPALSPEWRQAWVGLGVTGGSRWKVIGYGPQVFLWTVLDRGCLRDRLRRAEDPKIEGK